jgi:hypothetical protein
MTTTVKVTYTAQGFPDTTMTFDLTSIDIESIKQELPLKKKELDSKFNVDPRKVALEWMTPQLKTSIIGSSDFFPKSYSMILYAQLYGGRNK